MKRRDFLKTTGAGLVSFGLPSLSTATSKADSDPLAEADVRIKEYRQAQVTLKLSDPTGASIPPSTPVTIEQVRHKFLFGCNIFKLNRCKTDTDNAAYADRFQDLLNFATLPFYWWSYERQRGNPTDERTEAVVKWCQAHNIVTKGHPLAWNYIQPPWLAQENPKTAMPLQLKRIARCVEKFSGDIDIWDVVNEATHYDRDFCKERAPKLTQAITDMGIGEYVRQAFNAARLVGPKATLIINDYRTDPSFERKVIKELVHPGGKPMYDVIGLQSHMHTNYWGVQKAWNVCENFAKYKVPLHYTETTVVSGPKTDQGWHTTAQGEKEQAQKVAEFYTLLFSHPAVEAITWWDFTDQNAWQGAPAGLVRADMSPKPAYDRLKDLIKGQWWTTKQAQAKKRGRVRFRGFLGDYRVTAVVNGRKLSATFSLDKDAPKTIDLELAT